MVTSSIASDNEKLILALLSTRRSLTLEQVVALLPQLTWNQVFKSIDNLSRRGNLLLLRRGFQYEIRRLPTKAPVLASLS
jgi:hypothetical protein